ncbi:hypothetical protein JW824_04895 [bacterium]|nr:hypothetical protein [bacterium]RQV92919.1 MAG: hypothetical protein EH221_10605 [bacterium]
MKIVSKIMIGVIFLIPLGFVFGGSKPNQSNVTQSFSESMTDFNRSLLVSPQKTSVQESDLKSPSEIKAFFFSFLLPGAGEYYAGSKKMAKIFFSSEILLWTTYFSFRTYGNWKKEDYRNLAVCCAGVDLSGKDHQYFVNIENFDTIREYNEAKLRQRQFDEVYPDTPYYYWQWDSGTSRHQFEKLRIASDTAYHRSLFVIGGIVINHIVSGIDALRLARKNRQENENRVRIGLAGLPEGGLMVLLWKSF